MTARTKARESRELSRKLHAVAERTRRDFEAVARVHGLTALQARTILGLTEPVPMRSLANVMVCDASNVTGLADRLERLGLVERLTDPSDRRVKLLSLTGQGTEVQADLLRRVSTGSTVMARLTKAERTQLEALLDKLLAG